MIAQSKNIHQASDASCELIDFYVLT
jgi:hypothetical protein